MIHPLELGQMKHDCEAIKTPPYYDTMLDKILWDGRVFWDGCTLRLARRIGLLKKLDMNRASQRAIATWAATKDFVATHYAPRLIEEVERLREQLDTAETEGEIRRLALLSQEEARDE